MYQNKVLNKALNFVSTACFLIIYLVKNLMFAEISIEVFYTFFEIFYNLRAFMKGWIAKIFTSFIDVPDKVATAVYFSGCSIRCKNCHNKDIWEKESGTLMIDD